jgi:hypothetical protein
MLEISRSNQRAKLQSLHDPKETNGDIVEILRIVRNKEREYMNDKINELATNIKKNIGDLYRGINEFKSG